MLANFKFYYLRNLKLGEITISGGGNVLHQLKDIFVK